VLLLVPYFQITSARQNTNPRNYEIINKCKGLIVTELKQVLFAFS